jgi:glutathione S-transferase
MAASGLIKLVIGNKAYSSWSLRPWIMMAHAHIPFEEVVINIYDEKGKQAMRRHAPTGKVPVLLDGEVRVWESLAIMEYLAEKFPAKDIWPRTRPARAMARALSSEMHAGFMPLRQQMPTNFRRAPKKLQVGDDVLANVKRIEDAWADARRRHGRGGPFLFGRFCAADAMFAPVVNRLYAYDVPVRKPARDYMQAMMELPAWIAWHKDAAAEKWHNPTYDSM